MLELRKFLFASREQDSNRQESRFPLVNRMPFEAKKRFDIDDFGILDGASVELSLKASKTVKSRANGVAICREHPVASWLPDFVRRDAQLFQKHGTRIICRCIASTVTGTISSSLAPTPQRIVSNIRR